MYAPEDRTAKAIIRDTALEVFGAHGPAGASLKDVAARAGVSPSLIIKHYGSRDGLVAAVDDHVLGILGNGLEELADSVGAGPPAGALSAAAVLADPATTRYLSHLLLGDSPRSAQAYRRLHGFGAVLVARMRESGAVAADVDQDRLTAVLVAHELSIILLRDRLTEVLGTDPMSPDGLRGWWETVDRLYRGGTIGPGRPG